MCLIPVPGWASPGSYLALGAGVTLPLRSVTHPFSSPCCTHRIFIFFQTRAEGFTCIQQDGLLDHSLCPRAAFACDSNGDRCLEGDPDSQHVPYPAHLRVLDPQPCATYNCVGTGLGLSLTPLGNNRVVGGVHKLANSQISVCCTQRSPVYRSRPS